MRRSRDDRSTRPPGRRLARTCLAVLAAGVVATAGSGCDGTTSSGPRTTSSAAASQQVQKSGAGERRTDLEPLTDRFPALGSPVSATWYSGTLGRDEAPGPSSYWIDAVVRLSQEQTERLEQRYRPRATDDGPDVVEELRADLPSAPLLTSEELDRAFSTTGFVSRVWLDPGSGRLVLSATGQ